MRCLEIGPGKRRILGFETIDALPGPNADHVGDARGLPFPNATFNVLYAAHVIEHMPWYDTLALLTEWRRVLKSGGTLEVWTVDALRVAEALVAYERSGEWRSFDSWNRHGVASNPYLWCNGRIFSYARDDGDDSVNWHRAMFTPRHLIACFAAAGFTDVRTMNRSEIRTTDIHGECQLGVRGAVA